jgi:signal transduction histidine kinase
MKFLTAVSFISGGIMLVLTAKLTARKSSSEFIMTVLPIFSLIVILTMVSLLFSVIIGFDFGVVDISIREKSQQIGILYSITSNLPSVIMMVSFILIALTGLFETVVCYSRMSCLLLPLVSIFVMVVGTVALVGHIISIPLLFYYISDKFSPMTISTALLFVIWGIGAMLCYRAKSDSDAKIQDSYPIKITILSKLVIVFISFILIPMLFSNYVAFVSAKNHLTDMQISKMNTIANLKTNEIMQYFKHINADMEIARDFWNIKKNMPIVSAYMHAQSNPKYIVAKQSLDSQFKTFQKVNQYINFVLLNTKGEVVYESSQEHKHEAVWVKICENVLIKPKTEIYLSPIFHYDEINKKYIMIVGTSAHDEYGKLLGVIAIEINMAPIYQSIQDITELGATGETLIVEKQGTEVLYLSSLRYDKNAAFNKTIKLGGVVGVACQYAVSGENGSGMSIDYRGKQTLSAWRYIPLLNWGLVTKIDIDEVFATIYSFEQFIWFFGLVTLLSGIWAAFSIAKSIANPIRKLHDGAEIIGSGNLYYKVGTDASDEVGQLSRSFDKMVTNLKKITASRDDLNQEIRKREKVEEELMAAKIAADSANSAKSEFLSMMSHELRTPLNAIIGFSEILADEIFGALNEKQKEYVTDVLNSGQYLLSLINDVLDISKVEAGKMELKLSEVNIKSIVDNSILMIKEKTTDHNIKLIENVDESIGSILVDERKMKQIMFNLFSNAAKFTPDGGKIGIEVGKTNSNEVLITVWDTGIGIEEKDKPKIFVEFKQIDSELSRKYTGTGLGLALTKKLVELHGGKIWFESEGKDKGSKFSFTLPIKQKNVDN